jgi:putative transcriptional regulator
MITDKIRKRILLIAEPTIIGDLSFNRSVILLAIITKKDLLVLINKPLKYISTT